jgi:hypothetical protein
MNWDAIGAVAEAVSSVVVVITLIYVAIQVRAYNHQAFLASLASVYEQLNGFPRLIAESASLASIINRGRESYDSLNPDDMLRFDQTHALVVNGFENWLHQVNQAMPLGAFRDEQLRNIGASLRVYINNPGCARFMQKYELNMHPDLRELVRQSLDHFGEGNDPCDGAKT